MQEQIVKVDRIITEADLRITRGLWVNPDLARTFAGLRQGHGILMVNRQETMVRLVDCNGGQWTQWADPGQRFNVGALEEIVNDELAAIGVRLIRGKSTKVGRSAVLSVVKTKKKRKKAA
jgi:hypothetical protein